MMTVGTLIIETNMISILMYTVLNCSTPGGS